MNSDYLYSILNLYLKKETEDKKTILNVRKLDDEVEFSFNMNKIDDEKTDFVIPFDVYNDNLLNFINQYKEDLMIIDEKYNFDNENNICYYYVLFKNGRSISFSGFSMLDMNNLRNMLYNIDINSDEIRVNNIDEKREMAYKPRLSLQQAGFSSFASLFLIVLFFADLLVIALWIFKAIFK